MMESKNKKNKKYRIWSKPVLHKLGLSLTKSGPTESNHENKNHWVFGGASDPS